MPEYTAVITWSKKASEVFTDNTYSRAHTWSFDGGAVIEASSAPQVVPVPYSVEANVDPEEAFVASLSSCHMLWFLFLAAEKNYVVTAYTDSATGVMAKNAEGKLSMTRVTLRPEVEGNIFPSEVSKLHHDAHNECFIANSVKTAITIESVQPSGRNSQ